MIDAQKLQVLLEVLGRAPLTRAEQIIVQEVVDQLIALAGPTTPAAAPSATRETNGAHADVLETPARHGPLV